LRSIRYNINELQTLLLMDDLDIIAPTETWLNENFNDRELQLDGYNMVGRRRSSNKITLAVHTPL